MPRRTPKTPLVKQAGLGTPTWGPTTDAGTLRSGLDAPDELPPAFEALIVRFGELQTQFDRGWLTEATYADELARSVVVHDDGSIWTLGARSHQWYRKSANGEWIPTPPPEWDGVVRTPPAPKLAPVVDVLDPVAVVRDPGHIVVSEPVWHEVTDQASGETLPPFSNASSIVDELGAWDTTFSAVESSETAARKPLSQTTPGVNTVGLAAELGDDATAVSESDDAAVRDEDDLGLPPELFS